MRVLILANGEPPHPEWAQRIAAEHDLLLATDGAVHLAVGLGLTPDLVCGDFDSINMAVAQVEFPHARFLPTPDQEQADLEKAMLVAQEQGATAITIIGATGFRLDHTLAAFAVLLRHHSELPITLRTEDTSVIALSGTPDAPGEIELSTEPDDTISLLSFDGKASITLTGVRWPLRDETLEFATRGVSNRAAADRVQVRVHGGAILICHLKHHES
jgi:thiamine pyrophosphokinase